MNTLTPIAAIVIIAIATFLFFFKSKRSNAYPPVLANTQSVETLDEVKFDSTITTILRKFTKAPFTPFKHKNEEDGKVVTYDNILSFTDKTINTEGLVLALGEDFYKKGFLIYTTDDGAVCVADNTNQYEALKIWGTNGYNYDISPDELIVRLQALDAKYNLNLLLISVGFDNCAFLIKNSNVDWDNLAEDVYTLCPDVVDQGTETMERLVDELKTSKQLYFWWD
jgi:Domain of unknown function (DUF4253)